MSEGVKRLAFGGIGLAIGAAATAAAMGSGTPVTTADRAAVEKIVRDYILANPEILPQAMANLEARETAKVIRANRRIIETPFEGAWEGAADADVTLVEFFDYACGYCRAALPDIDRLLREDKKLRIVYRELPVLGLDSESAARVSLAAAKAGKYPQFHRALFAAGRPDTATVASVARANGIDTGFARSQTAQSEIGTNLELQRELRLTGTPSWIVGDKVLGGAVGYDALKSAIAELRASRVSR